MLQPRLDPMAPTSYYNIEDTYDTTALLVLSAMIDKSTFCTQNPYKVDKTVA